MGTWRYYSVRMKMSDAASRIKFASEVTEDRTLDTHVQRALNEGRTTPIMNYLSRTDERFFNSLVVAALVETHAGIQSKLLIMLNLQ